MSMTASKKISHSNKKVSGKAFDPVTRVKCLSVKETDEDGIKH